MYNIGKEGVRLQKPTNGTRKNEIVRVFRVCTSNSTKRVFLTGHF